MISLYRPSAAPWDFQPQGSFVETFRWRSLELHKHDSALGVAATLRPVQPVTLVRPHAARRAARFFVEKFPGTSMYAVKANPSPALLRELWAGGITHYDVASIAEVRVVRQTLGDAATHGFIDRKSVGTGKSVSVREDIGG